MREGSGCRHEMTIKKCNGVHNFTTQSLKTRTTEDIKIQNWVFYYY